MNFWRSKKAQTTLELALSFIVLILFLLGAVKTMLWFGDNLAGRAQYYRATRPQVIASPPGASGIGYEQSKLSLFYD
ncbi:MAG: hypothetical protein D4S01_05195 [Dehalococcoidia bacterium]|nr:MAG: hypothetical protein D4S01_05195 [Dehalococcoidia bacterium]